MKKMIIGMVFMAAAYAAFAGGHWAASDRVAYDGESEVLFSYSGPEGVSARVYENGTFIGSLDAGETKRRVIADGSHIYKVVSGVHDAAKKETVEGPHSSSIRIDARKNRSTVRIVIARVNRENRVTELALTNAVAIQTRPKPQEGSPSAPAAAAVTPTTPATPTAGAAQNRLPDLKAYFAAANQLASPDWDFKNKPFLGEDPADTARFGNLTGDLGRIDSYLEFALITYYSAAEKTWAERGNAILPLNNPRLADRQLGAMVLKELAEIKFLDPSNTAAIGRYEGMLKFISDKNGVTRAEMQDYLKQGIAEIVDKYYSQRGMLDITPSVVYAEWKRNGVSHGLDGLQIVKDKLAAFYLSPTAENFAALRGIMASYDETEERYSDPLAYEAGSAFSRTLRELSNPLWDVMIHDKRTASAAIAAAGSAGRDLGIFSQPYYGTR
jgi:hypothetical protein